MKTLPSNLHSLPVVAVVAVPPTKIRPSPENDKLYKPIDPRDPAIIALAGSISQSRLLEPLILSADYYILSGHRRFAACKLAGLSSVPCRIRTDVHHDDDPDGFVALLAEHNRQRVKSLDERVREEVALADPDVAYQQLIAHRRQKSNIPDFRGSTIELREARGRKRISNAKKPFLDAVQRVLEQRREFWPLSDRQIHYALLNDPPLVHASKPQSRYRNDLHCYNALTDLLTRARLCGLIPMEVIADETRPVSEWKVHREAGAFIRQELSGLFKGYWRDLQQSQPNHIELVVEKNTLRNIVEPVAMEYCIPVTSGRGYCSLPPRASMDKRCRNSGKDKLILLIISDFDPDGEQIAESFARSMRDDFHINNTHAVKVALTWEQVRRLKLPQSMKAKARSSTRSRFVDQYGEDVFEVEAMEPEELQRTVRERAMQYSSVAGENVLDLFGGSGSTLIAAEQTGRHAYLMEIDPLYCDVICDRYQRFTGRPAILERTGDSPIPMKPREEVMR